MHSAQAPPTLLDPYIGLRPYTDSDDDRARFFGREQDQEIIIANLYAASLTVFYGASGVGKSSVLLAGVVPELRQMPQFACVVFRTWQLENVLSPLKAAVVAAVQIAARREIKIDIAMPLDDFLLQCGLAFRGRVILIFDQFEEYFLYHAASDVSEGFDAEFARSINRNEIDASFLLSMREDSLSKLDRFQGRIPKLLNNLLRLDHLDREGARRAILGPLAACNKRLPPGESPLSIDDDLVEELLDQVRSDSVTPDHAKNPEVSIARATPSNTEVWIETSFLQVVLTRLWGEEKKHGSRHLRLATLKNLGDAPKILSTHLDETMGKLTSRERRVAVNIFGYLVTPSGGKIAHTVADLASYSRCSKSQLAPLVERLADSKIRVLRAIPPAPGEPEGVRYEIFHDVLAAAILAWRRRELAWRRVWWLSRWALGLWVALFMLAASYLLYSRQKAWKEVAANLAQQRQSLVEKGRNFRENAEAVLASGDDPIRDVTALQNLALALNFDREDTAAARLTRNLLLRRVWCPPAAPEARYRRDTLLAAAFAPGGSNNEVFAAAGDGQLLFWNGRELSPVCSLFEKPRPGELQVVQPGFASFSPDGQWLLTIPPTLVSTVNTPGPGPAQQSAPSPFARNGREACKLQVRRWSLQKGEYELAGGELEFQRLPGARINFAWSPESDRVVLINTRLNEANCAFFEVKENTFQQLVEQSDELNRMKVVAVAFAVYRSGIAAISIDPTAPALRRVSFLHGDDFQSMPVTGGQDSIRLAEGFQPDGLAFGPGDNQLTLTSFSGIRILDLSSGSITPLPPPTFRDQLMRIVIGPGNFTRRLVAKSLYGRVEVAKGTRMQEPAEPAVFRGSIGVAQFSSDGQRILILSGGLWNVFDNMRLIDVSALYRTFEAAPKKFEAKAAPPWLADIASAVSALDTSGDGALLTLESVRQRYPESKAGDPYEPVWKRFFPDERTDH